MSTADPLRLGEPDAGELLTLQLAAYVQEARAHRNVDLVPLLDTLEDVRAALRDPALLAWGIRDSGRLVASVRARVRGEIGEVGRLVVAPDQQRRGLGRSLMLAVEVLLPPEVTTLLLFTGQHSAGPLALYASLGYTETHRTPEAGYELVHLEKARPRSTPVNAVR
ncbi:GNAT family N-acetyltransferase [Amycolatopsis alkalitolerans]|uniref:GNAT family N-acetyltransferase n=1 Tax=Amycolatopsis alkalitolerans TaxID=2547244 RepID=A0A5C4M531_9PSEU|nr:GNAT family N-acetyltransferase [Amycolatopsis alkalitolerans]TNC28196.1 GNAT family N-acetyltransferase [Amycolatopsis alkalitolerans]